MILLLSPPGCFKVPAARRCGSQFTALCSLEHSNLMPSSAHDLYTEHAMQAALGLHLHFLLGFKKNLVGLCPWHGVVGGGGHLFCCPKQKDSFASWIRLPSRIPPDCG